MTDMQMPYIPSSLKVFVNQLQGYYTSVTKIELDRQGATIPSGSTLNFRLPANSLVDLNSLAWHAKVTVAANARVPPLEMFIERLTVRAGGEVIDDISGYGRLFAMLYDASATTAHRRNRSLYNFDPVERIESVDLALTGDAAYSATTYLPVDALFTTAATAIGSIAAPNGAIVSHKMPQGVASATPRYATADQWLGFLGSQHIIDTSLFPQSLEVEIVLNSDVILSTSSYTLSDVACSVSVLKFADYQRTLFAQLAAGMTLDYPFTTYKYKSFDAPAVGSGTTRSLTVSGSNIKSIWFSQPTHQTAGYTTGALYNRYFTSTQNGITAIWANVNGSTYPSMKPRFDREGFYDYLRQLGNKSKDVLWDCCIDSDYDYRLNQWAWRLSFEYPYATSKELSGLNTNGSSVDVLINVDKGADTTAGAIFLAYTEQAHILHVGAQRQFTITR